MQQKGCNKVLLLCFFLLPIFIFSCARKPECVPNKSHLPLSKQATFVESTSTVEVTIRATGKGCDVESAMEDAKKAALWYILFAGDRPILKTSAEREKFKDVERLIFSRVDDYVRWESDIKDKRIKGVYTLVTILVKLDKGLLEEDLKRRNVIKGTEDILEEVGYPTIYVAYTDNKGKVAATTIQEYLQDRGFEVFVKSGSEKVDKIIKEISSLEGMADPHFALALQTGSDILIKVDVVTASRRVSGVRVDKASVTVQAYQSTTGKLLASSTGYSPERKVTDISSVIQEAAQDAADKITFQIKKEWTKVIRRGRPFKIIIMAEGNANVIDENVYEALKELSKGRIRRTASGKNIFTYLVYVKDINNAFELYRLLKDRYGGFGRLEKVMDTGYILILKAEGNDIDLRME